MNDETVDSKPYPTPPKQKILVAGAVAAMLAVAGMGIEDLVSAGAGTPENRVAPGDEILDRTTHAQDGFKRAPTKGRPTFTPSLVPPKSRQIDRDLMRQVRKDVINADKKMRLLSRKERRALGKKLKLK